MSQDQLFVTDIYDALSDIVRALGGPKKVGGDMRPDRPLDEAARWVKDCLNRDRREKFDPDQIMWLLKQGRLSGCHAAINYICSECGYSTPLPINPEDQLAKLQRQYIEAVKALQALTPKIEETRKLVRAI